MKERRAKNTAVALILVSVVMAAASLVSPVWKRRGQSGYATFISLPSTAEAAAFNPWEQAVRKVKEERGEPTGKQADIDIPQQLKHYSDKRRFLATQVAEWREHRFETPQDFVGLAELIKRGELVAVKPVTEDYVLYGVGGNAGAEPFTHYEKRSGKRIPLYGEAELAVEYARIDETRAALESDIESLQREFEAVDKRERSRRAELRKQITAKEKSLKSASEKKELLDDAYGNAENRRQLFAGYEKLDALAKDFSSQTYDLDEARSRREMKVRMLSFLRPEAVRVLEEIAISYRQKFNRPLPLTSLVRPDEYQYLLSKVNANATRIETPPHSTGLAFDVYYRFMTAEEQSHVMADLARLKDEGRIEVLRENRDHFHVFAFVDGERPRETLILESLGKTAAMKTSEDTEKVTAKETAKETKASEKASRQEERRSGKKEVERGGKKEAKREVKREAVKRKEAKREAPKNESKARRKKR